MNTSVHFDITDWEQAKILSVRQRITFAEFVRRAVSHYLTCDQTNFPNPTSELRVLEEANRKR